MTKIWKREYRLNRLQDELILSFDLPYYGARYMHFHFINVWTGQEMTISCKAKGRESNDSKNNRMWYRIILLNKFIFFLLYSGIYMYKICFLFKTMTSRFKSSSYILMFTTQPIPPPKKKSILSSLLWFDSLKSAISYHSVSWFKQRIPIHNHDNELTA